MTLSDLDRDDLRYAKSLLATPSFAARVANAIGAPIEKGFGLLPANWSDVVRHATRTALRRALDVAVSTMRISFSALYSKYRTGRRLTDLGTEGTRGRSTSPS